MSKNKNRFYGEIPIDVWDPYVSSKEFIMRIQAAAREKRYALALELYEQAENEVPLSELNIIRSVCASELIAARQWRKG